MLVYYCWYQRIKQGWRSLVTSFSHYVYFEHYLTPYFLFPDSYLLQSSFLSSWDLITRVDLFHPCFYICKHFPVFFLKGKHGWVYITPTICHSLEPRICRFVWSKGETPPPPAVSCCTNKLQMCHLTQPGSRHASWRAVNLSHHWACLFDSRWLMLCFKNECC